MSSHTAGQSIERADVEALLARYGQERARRINPDKGDQFVEAGSILGNDGVDPYAEPAPPRAPIARTVDAVIVGGGFGGLLAAVELRRQGIDDILIVEQASDFGGVWYWNRYPGAQCDIESYIYMPLLEETGYVPTEKYAHAPEIFAHAQRIGRHFDLYERALFRTRIETMDWDEAAGRWHVATDQGDRLSARYVVTASGPLNRAKLPRIPGIGSFRGKMFHTSRWDYEYTGGDSNGGMDRLRDKTVAVVGTGATAVQCAPYLACDAGKLYVVQRTPSNVARRGNMPTDPSWVASLSQGWQRRRRDNFTAMIAGVPVERDEVADGWTELFQDLTVRWRPANIADLPPEEVGALALQADLRKGEEARAWIDRHVTKPGVADRLKPWYGMLCKRPAFNDQYLPCFNRDNVELIDTEGQGIERITPSGLVCNGVEYPVDCIIFATGFEVGTAENRSAGSVIRGVDGETLTAHFAEGPRTLHGFFAHGFPNLFLLGSGNNGVKPNFTDMLGEQAEHIGWIIGRTRAAGHNRIEATAEAEAAWREVIREKSQPVRAVLESCTPGYFNSEGDIERSWAANTYGGGPIEFNALIADWRARGDMDGLDIR